MSITLVTGLIYNISCKQSDSEDPVTPYIINNSQSIVSTDIIDDQSRFSVLKASAGVEPTTSFRDERYNYYVFYLGRMSKDNNGSTALYFANYESKDRFLEPKEGIIAQLLAAGARE